jgi:hypothetical protein
VVEANDNFSKITASENDTIKSQIAEAMNLIPLTLGKIQNKEKSLRELPKDSLEAEMLKTELRELIREDDFAFYTLIKWSLELAYGYLPPMQQSECFIYLLSLDTTDYTWLETIPVMNQYCRYSLKVLKDSNLAELGKKSRVAEIMERIEVDEKELIIQDKK